MSAPPAPLSFSRLKRWAQCRKAYQLHYIDKAPAKPNVAVRFGSLMHVPLERAYQHVIDQQIVGRFPESVLVDAFKDEWARSGLTEFAQFEEGLGILRAYARQHPEVDHRSVLAVEKEFLLPVGRFRVLGYIDRVDRIDDETVGVVDYKSNRTIFTREEVDHDLQLSIYAMAARELWPWAKRVRLGFDLLRHGIHMATDRSDEQLEAVREYIGMLGAQLESAVEFPATLNENCTWCDHADHCATYHRALLGKVESVCRDTDDLEAVAREREEVARTAKILYARKDELERILKRRLEDVDRLELGGMVYSIGKTTQVAYPTAPTLAVFRDVLGKGDDQLAALLLAVDKAKVDGLLKDLSKTLGPADVRLIRARLDAVAEKSISPRFSAQRATSAGGAP